MKKIKRIKFPIKNEYKILIMVKKFKLSNLFIIMGNEIKNN